MATEIKLRRGTKAQHDDGAGFTGAVGEITVDTTDDTLRVHDGSLKGGHVIAKLSDVQASDTLAELSDTTITSTAAGHILIHDGSDSFDNKAVSGAITINSSGVTTLESGQALTNLGGGSGTTFLRKDGTFATPTNTTYSIQDGELSQNNFTDADHSKLNAIEASADVTDTVNVVAALTAGDNITIAADGTITATDTNTTYSIEDGELSENNFTDADHTKLNNIEASADVTDTTNVVAALTAGTNVSIAGDGTISSTDTTYSVQDGELSQNSFTNDDHTKLNAIEASADVTDTTNVVAALTAGTNIAIAGNGTISATDTTYSVQDGELSQNNFTNDDHTKLNNIEAGADVTDATNVVAALTAGTNIAIAGNGTISSTNTTYTGGTGLTLDGTTFNVDAAQTGITSLGTLSGLTTGATTVNGILTANGPNHLFTHDDIANGKHGPVVELFANDTNASSEGGAIAFTGLNEDGRKVSYASIQASRGSLADDGEHTSTFIFTVADGSGAVDPFDNYTDDSYRAGHSIALNISSTYFISNGYLQSDVGELRLGSKQSIKDSAEAPNDQGLYDLHMPNSTKAKVISIGGIGPFDAWITGNQTAAQMIRYRGQHMLMVAGGALEFDLPACVASADISATTCNVGDVFQISNAAGGALTIDRDGSGTAQTVYHFPSLTLTPFTNNPTLAVGGTMMLQAVAANVWMVFNPTGLTDA